MSRKNEMQKNPCNISITTNNANFLLCGGLEHKLGSRSQVEIHCLLLACNALLPVTSEQNSHDFKNMHLLLCWRPFDGGQPQHSFY